MEWKDIHDPKNEVDFAMERTLVSKENTPEEIQNLISEKGVQQMVAIVNEHFRLLTGRPALILSLVGQRKTVTQY